VKALELPSDHHATVAPPPIDNPYAVVDRVIKLNREHEVLRPYREKAQSPKPRAYTINHEGLLLYQDQLFVPDVNFIRTYLIRTIHAHQVTAHPSKRKTGKLLREKYF